MLDISLIIIDRDGVQHRITAPTDMSMNLMEVIRSSNLAPEGTIGICGGMAMCASCHCYVNTHDGLNQMSDEEEAMLYESLNMQSNSRLSCQIPITKDIDGLKLTIAKEE